MPIVVGLQPLDETALVKIMTEPKNAIVKQYKKLVGIDDVEKVIIDKDVVLGKKGPEIIKKSIA